MTIDKNQISRFRFDRFEYSACYRGRRHTAGLMLHCGVAAVDHGRRTWMESDLILEVLCPLSNVLEHQLKDVPTSRAEQPDHIGCSVLAQARNLPTSLYQLVEDGRSCYLQLFARGFSREPD